MENEQALIYFIKAAFFCHLVSKFPFGSFKYILQIHNKIRLRKLGTIHETVDMKFQ